MMRREAYQETPGKGRGCKLSPSYRDEDIGAKVDVDGLNGAGGQGQGGSSTQTTGEAASLSKCNKDTESRVHPVTKRLVCAVCKADKGAAPQSAPACQAIVSVSTDEWVMMNKASGARLYTQDLLGCIALVVESRDRIALAHVLDREKPAGDEDKTHHELDLIVAVLKKANITGRYLIAKDPKRDTRTFTLVKAWAEKNVPKDKLKVHRGFSCVMLFPDVAVGRQIGEDEKHLLKNPKTGVKWITNWGKLPQWKHHTE
jgi:hypothetical protein